MLFAYIDKKRLYAENCVDRVDYHDGFNNIMRLVKPKQKITDHFRYKCGENKIDYERDTQEHRDGEKFLKEFFIKQYPQTDIEVIFLDIMRRADVYVPEQNIVLELQCSNTTTEKMEGKEVSHGKRNNKVIWIFGVKEFCNNCGDERISLRKIERYVNDKYHVVYYVAKNKIFSVIYSDIGYKRIHGISSVKYINHNKELFGPL